jgi:hypothetical protein
MIIQTDIPKGDLVALLDHSGQPAPFNLRPEGPASPRVGGPDHCSWHGRVWSSRASKHRAIRGRQDRRRRAARHLNATCSSSCGTTRWRAASLPPFLHPRWPEPASSSTSPPTRFTLQGFVDDHALIELITPVVSVLPETTPSFDASLSFTQASRPWPLCWT